MNGRLTFPAALALGWLTGCAGGSETGNPVALGLELRTGDPEVAIGSTDTGTLTVEQAWLSLGKPHFALGSSACEDTVDALGDESDAEPLLVADATSIDVKLTLQVPPGEYCGVAVPLPTELSELPSAAPTALADHPLVVVGRTADGTPFVLAYPDDEPLELLAVTGESFSIAEDARVLLIFDAARWFEGLRLDEVPPDADGVIRIDEDHDPVRLDLFEQNVECSLTLVEDVDASGSMSDADVPLAACDPDDD